MKPSLFRPASPAAHDACRSSRFLAVIAACACLFGAPVADAAPRALGGITDVAKKVARAGKNAGRKAAKAGKKVGKAAKSAGKKAAKAGKKAAE